MIYPNPYWPLFNLHQIRKNKRAGLEIGFKWLSFKGGVECRTLNGHQPLMKHKEDGRGFSGLITLCASGQRYREHFQMGYDEDSSSFRLHLILNIVRDGWLKQQYKRGKMWKWVFTTKLSFFFLFLYGIFWCLPACRVPCCKLSSHTLKEIFCTILLVRDKKKRKKRWKKKPWWSDSSLQHLGATKPHCWSALKSATHDFLILLFFIF